MAEQSKFSGVLQALKHREGEEASHPPPVAHLESTPVRGRGRPPGKRSDPDYQATTVLLRKQTKKKASRLLEDTNSAHDLSDLLEHLLTEWIEKQS